ncbi:MAG: hypothetical protein ACREV5_09205, partial [Steroidobacter sp.]
MLIPASQQHRIACPDADVDAVYRLRRQSTPRVWVQRERRIPGGARPAQAVAGVSWSYCDHDGVADRRHHHRR